MSTLTAPPSEFTVESFDTSITDVHQLFGGTKLASSGPARYGKPKWDAWVLEAERLIERVVEGTLPVYALTEAMSSDVFPALFADSLDRQLYGAYTAAPTTWQNYCRRAEVNDFRPVKRFATTGVRNLLQEVKPGAPAPERGQQEKEYSYSVRRLEAGFGVMFETYINDDLGALKRLPADLAQSAIDTEEYEVTKLWAGASGLNPAFFTAGNDNVAENNAPLTRAAIQAGLTRLLKRKDERGNPIVVTAVELVVGPGLKLAAEQIMDATEYRVKDANGNETIIKGNGISGNFRLNTNFWLPSVAQTNADTTWALFASATQTARPAMELGFLRGYTAPALYEKVPDMRRIGGGEVPWSYDHGDQRKKVVHILGGSAVDERMVIGSNGSNTP